MKIQDQVCSRRQGNDLRRLGIAAATFFWMRSASDNWVVHLPHQPSFPHEYADDWAPAFTVAELGVMIDCNYVSQRLHMRDLSLGWTCCKLIMGEDGLIETGHNMDAETEAQARAFILIYLLESGKVTAEEVNNRLAS